MQKKILSSVDKALEELASILSSTSKDSPPVDIVEGYLSHRNNLVVSKAALCVSKFRFKNLVSVLPEVYSRFVNIGPKVDKGCLAKKAVVKALDSLEYSECDWFINVSCCVQIDPVYGGGVDSGSEVRIAALRSLGRFPWFRVSRCLVTKLGDPVPNVRIAALEVISSYGGTEPEMAILAKTVSGDDKPEVLGYCFTALLSINPEFAIPFTAEYLDANDEQVRIEAALALGQCHDPRSFPFLREAWERWGSFDLKKVLITSLKLLRCDEAFQFVNEIAEDPMYKQLVGDDR